MGGGSQRSARVVLDELVEGLGLRVRVLEHPEEVLEEDDLAADDGAAGLGGAAGAVDEGLEQRVGHELLGDEVPAARPADVDRVQALGHLVRGAVERRAPGAGVLAGRRRAGDAAGRVPPPDHAPELPQPALRHCRLRAPPPSTTARDAAAANAHQARRRVAMGTGASEGEREGDEKIGLSWLTQLFWHQLTLKFYGLAQWVVTPNSVLDIGSLGRPSKICILRCT